MMKMTDKALIITPYISTTWDNIASLRLKTDPFFSFQITPILVIQLKNMKEVEVPHLSPTELEQIFESFHRYLERGVAFQNVSDILKPAEEPPILSASLLEHNSEQSHLANLPEKMLEKLCDIVKKLGVMEMGLLGDAEPHCNCIHCQLVRGMNGSTQEAIDEEVSEEDLRFRDWDIQELSKNLYSVTNPLDESETYQVFLGDSIGCTCGSKSCEHIRAALSE